MPFIIDFHTPCLRTEKALTRKKQVYQSAQVKVFKLFFPNTNKILIGASSRRWYVSHICANHLSRRVFTTGLASSSWALAVRTCHKYQNLTSWFYLISFNICKYVYFRFTSRFIFRYLNRWSYMSAHVYWIYLTSWGKQIKCEVCRAFSSLSLFCNELNKFNNTRARMLDSIYHLTLRLLWKLISAVKTL